MGKRDTAVNQLLERKDIFADLINGTLYHGKPVLCPDRLELLSPRSGLVYQNKKGKRKALDRFGDIRMKAETKAYSVVFAGEAQSGVHYAMPLRMMLYSALEYNKQLQELEHRHKRNKDLLTRDEFLSGIARSDRICPVVNLVFYLGDDWNGSKSLYDMLDIDWNTEEARQLKQYLPDYLINLITARDISDPEVYTTCLQQIFYLLKYNKDKSKLYRYVNDHRTELNQMDSVEQTAAIVLMGDQKLLDRLLSAQAIEPEKGIDMCKAIDDLILDGEKRGKRQGKKIGRKVGEKRVTDLILALTADSKEYLIKQMAVDEMLRQKLFQQYGL